MSPSRPTPSPRRKLPPLRPFAHGKNDPEPDVRTPPNTWLSAEPQETGSFAACRRRRGGTPSGTRRWLGQDGETRLADEDEVPEGELSDDTTFWKEDPKVRERMEVRVGTFRRSVSC